MIGWLRCRSLLIDGYGGAAWIPKLSTRESRTPPHHYTAADSSAAADPAPTHDNQPELTVQSKTPKKRNESESGRRQERQTDERNETCSPSRRLKSRTNATPGSRSRTAAPPDHRHSIRQRESDRPTAAAEMPRVRDLPKRQRESKDARRHDGRHFSGWPHARVSAGHRPNPPQQTTERLDARVS